MPRKKKKISVDIDTKNVDVKIERNEEGLNASIDTPVLDVQIEKKEGKVKVKVKADENLIKPFRNTRRKISQYK